MDAAILIEYAWVLLVLIGLEGILAADNAVVLAMMVKHLPDEKRKKALFYGLAGAFVFRFASLFLISILINVWQVQAVGAIYLLYLSLHFLFNKYVKKKEEDHVERPSTDGFWKTVIKVEIADIAFAIDSMLAAVAIAITLPVTPLPNIGELDGGQFLVIFAGGMIGIIIMRFAAGAFVKVLQSRPGLETGAYLIVGWVGVKLAVYTMCHPKVALLPVEFAHSTAWKLTFWGVLIGIVVISWLTAKKVGEDTPLGQVE
ncbi:TerC family protein [bacterium LRH843]|nr:TerC family protein [bacterium LRH843]